MMIPKGANIQTGIVFHRVIDSLETTIDLETDHVVLPHLFGTATINDRLTMLPNFFSILAAVAGVRGANLPAVRSVSSEQPRL